MSLITIKGTLSAAVTASGGTFTASVPLNAAGLDLKSFQAQFPVTTGAFYGAMGHSLVIGGNAPLTNIKDFTVALTNQSTLTITNRTTSAWAAGTSFVLQMDQRGPRLYQDNDPLFARKTMPVASCALVHLNLGMPLTASTTGVVGSAAFGTTTSSAGTEKLTSSVYLDVPRNVTITSNNASDTSSYTVKVTGKDVYGSTLVETIAFNGAASVSGIKAFSIVTSVKAIHASGTALNGTCSAGFGTTLGLPVAVPSAGFVVKEILNGAAATAGTFAYADATAGGATATTGDVRGTYIPNSAPDGSRVWELILALPDPGNIGIAQYAG